MKSKPQITRTVSFAAGLLAISLSISSCGTPELGIGSTQISPQDGMVLVYVPAGEFLMGSAYSAEPQESKTERGRFIVEVLV